MNQGKLDVVKQEMAKSEHWHELKWKGMGEFNSDGHYIYYCGQESLRRNGVALMVNKRVWSTSVKSQKQQNYLRSFPKQTIQHHSNPSLCPTTDAEEAEIEQFYEDLQDLLELTPAKDFLFILGDWNAKLGSKKHLE